MIANKIYSLEFSEFNSGSELHKNTWICILHASRIPPHVGLMINGNYNSLTIKGRETNISGEALLKTIFQKKIEALFIRVVKHPVFSSDHQLHIFHEQLNQFSSVGNEATCLTPLKVFFEEFYAVPNQKDTLLIDFLSELEENDYIAEVKALNIASSPFIFNSYTKEELNERIRTEREAIKKP